MLHSAQVVLASACINRMLFDVDLITDEQIESAMTSHEEAQKVHSAKFQLFEFSTFFLLSRMMNIVSSLRESNMVSSTFRGLVEGEVIGMVQRCLSTEDGLQRLTGINLKWFSWKFLPFA